MRTLEDRTLDYMRIHRHNMSPISRCHSSTITHFSIHHTQKKKTSLYYRLSSNSGLNSDAIVHECDSSAFLTGKAMPDMASYRFSSLLLGTYCNGFFSLDLTANS